MEHKNINCTSPNPNFSFEQICSKCGKYLYYIGDDLIKPVLCHCNFILTNYAWVCSRCGSSNGPDTKTCPNCSPQKIEITF
jgi:ribosomal protein L40E